MWCVGQAWEEAAALTFSYQGDQSTLQAPRDQQKRASVNLRQATVRQNTSISEHISLTKIPPVLWSDASIMCTLFKDSFRFMFAEERLLFSRRIQNHVLGLCSLVFLGWVKMCWYCVFSSLHCPHVDKEINSCGFKKSLHGLSSSTLHHLRPTKSLSRCWDCDLAWSICDVWLVMSCVLYTSCKKKTHWNV